MKVIPFDLFKNSKDIFSYKRLPSADLECKNLQLGKSADEVKPLSRSQIIRRAAGRIDVAVLAGKIAAVGNGYEDI